MQIYALETDGMLSDLSPCPGATESNAQRQQVLRSMQRILALARIHYAEYQQLAAVLAQECICEPERRLLERISRGIQDGTINVVD